MIDKLNHYSLNNPASVYDEEALTALELAGRTASKVNEVVEDQNKLRTETEKHLDEQDTKIEDHREYLEQAVKRQDETIATDINNIKTATVPKAVTSEVQKRIDNGEFYAEIDKHLGNLNNRVDNLLGNVPAGGTTSDAELVDIRVDSEGQTHANAGASVRWQSKYVSIPLTFSKNRNYTVTIDGWRAQPDTNFHMSDPVKINKSWSQILIYTHGINPYRARAVFTRKDDKEATSIIQVVSEHSTPGLVDIDIPEGAEYVYIANDVDYNGDIIGVGTPAVYYNKLETDRNLDERAGKGANYVDMVNGAMDEQTITFIANNRFINNMGYLKEGAGFKLSRAISVPDGCLVVFDTFTPNEYVGKICFSKNGMLGGLDTQVGLVYPTPTAGRYVFMTPPGYNYIYVSSDTDIDGKTFTTPRLYIVQNQLGESILELTKGKSSQTVTLNIPDRYNLVHGKMFELFYKGLIKGVRPLNYDIKITCDIGKVYKRKYAVTPISTDVGEHPLTFTVRDDNGNVIASKTVTLCVNAKPTKPSTEKTVLCIGDSLTAGGEWIDKCENQLVSAGIDNVRFIGSKEVNGNRFEATGGYGIETYVNQSDNNPFYPSTANEWSLTNYLTSIGESNVDIVCVFLGWNNRFMSRTDYGYYLGELLNNITYEFPNVKFLLFGLQFPDKDGLGESYGASWDFLETVQYVIDHETLLNITVPAFNSRVVNISGQFDTEYNMPTATRKVNNRNSTTETYINNGVHPSENGYNQISDVAYCELVAMLKEVD